MSEREKRKTKYKECGRSCCVVNCSNRVKRASQDASFLSFFRLPQGDKNARLKKAWTVAIRRLQKGSKMKIWSPAKPHFYVCSKHFVAG